MKCINCGNENKNTNIRCEFCGTELNSFDQNDNFLNKDYFHANIHQINLNSKKVKLIINAILIFMLAPFFIAGVAFIAISVYSNISDNNKAKNYLKTEGKLVSYGNCEYDNDGEELCNAIYEYVVNGVTYKGSPNLLSNSSGFKEITTVKYNPNNPNEYIMDSGWNSLLITGIIMVVVVSLIFISARISIIKIANKINDTIKKGNQV